MNRILAAALLLALTGSVAACGSSSSRSTATTTALTVTAPTPPATTAAVTTAQKAPKGVPASLPVILAPDSRIGTVSITAAGVARTPVMEGPWRRNSKGQCTSIMYTSPTTFLKALDKGPGHYPCNALPWQNGTVILSGHRVTHTTPFDNLGNVRLGQTVRLRTAHGTFLYRIVPPPNGHPYVTSGYGAQTAPCIQRRACGVLAMPPPGATVAQSFRMVGWIFRWHFSDGHRLILLACNPKHNLTHRIAVFAKRVR